MTTAPAPASRGAATPDPSPRRDVVHRRPARVYWRQTGWRHLIGAAIVVFSVFPLVYVLSASLSSGGTLITANSLFSDISLDSYVELFDRPQQPYAAWFGNTLFIGLTASAGSVLLGALAAYAFSRMRFTGRRVGLISLLLVQMFPQLLAMVAIFLLMLTIGDVFPAIGVNSQVGLILVYLGGALGVNTYLMYGFFNTIPREIDEAAKIDGATHAQTYWTIVLRLVTPILAVVALLSIIATFGEFVIARVLLQSESSWTLAVGLYSWVSSLLEANWGLFAAGAVISTVPILVLFLFLQRYIVGGLTAGSVKG